MAWALSFRRRDPWRTNRRGHLCRAFSQAPGGLFAPSSPQTLLGSFHHIHRWANRSRLARLTRRRPTPASRWGWGYQEGRGAWRPRSGRHETHLGPDLDFKPALPGSQHPARGLRDCPAGVGTGNIWAPGLLFPFLTCQRLTETMTDTAAKDLDVNIPHCRGRQQRLLA